MSLGVPELIIILVIVLVLFGSTRLPKLARSLGQASKEFKDGMNTHEQEEAAKTEAKDEPVTMTRGELDALLAEREAQARAAAAPPPPPPPPPAPPPSSPAPPVEGTPPA
jgi:sec-independent protein translocase protein TatA